MTQSQCPRCGAKASGNFCASCGAALAKRFCNDCGAPADSGARFCTTCGTPVAGAGAGISAAPSSPGRGAQPVASGAATGTAGESTLGWWIAGVMLIALMGVVTYPILRQDEVALQPLGQAPIGGAGAVDLSTMTPREAADRLYTRVMETAANGDSASVTFFVPMAIQAYENAEPLNDTDGLFHLSSLQRTAGAFPAAVITADRALALVPNHLLALYAKGEAQIEMADTTAAAVTFQTLLDVWDAERATNHQDYLDHERMLADIQSRAREVVAGG